MTDLQATAVPAHDGPELLQQMRGPVLWLTINRPARRNAMSPAVLDGLAAAISGAQKDRAVRAIVITGVGDKAFCAGADLQTGTAFAYDHSEPFAQFANTLRVAHASVVPLIARVNGACMAGGMGLMAMCHMAVAAPHAVFGLPEVKVGLFPAQVLAVLGRLVPQRVLAEMCLAGEPLQAAQAMQYNLINAVAQDLDAGVQALLDRLLDKSPAAQRRGLYMLKAMQPLPFEESMRFAESQIALFALTDDAKEGQLAFREKRAPNWTGR